ncbi:tRNA (adenosine(37)-N6)-dimethylallyltransferase MiaA [Reichenbachiella ulvae]|uniref:tRNA dimethylallyltransferase n=1 Tax=Reichenbachiella ulvae TaxID=2980104 RepID=A0ABT3CN88_9BACT|nr:tRNA (adenosine(37)-N6)-dimethylallyltransferase MiaA [Reichenbachiella ulvae]MCV9385165.1 tRNA (adenosine(37)-N6)-dimethylallyltransferase MiaA [Reichenbachiella ulvae]
MKIPHLVVVVGPTAVGKTATCIQLANHFDAEIISADSRQFYKEMEIGTAKPDAKELAQAKHYFIDSHSIVEEYDAGSFSEDARSLLNDIYQKTDIAFSVGGSGLYIKALCDGLDDMPEVEEGLRSQLRQEWEENGLEPLLEELMLRDPEYYEQVDRYNHQRVIRALEVIRSSGASFTAFRQANQKEVVRPFTVTKIGIEENRETLYQRIDDRMDLMIEQGLFEEAEKLYPQKELNALQTVGYKEIFGYLDGEYDKEEAIRLLKRNSRRYAKRQMTWFKRDEEVVWFRRDQTEEMIQLIEKNRVNEH